MHLYHRICSGMLRVDMSVVGHMYNVILITITTTDFARQFLSHFIHCMQIELTFLWICPNDGKPWRKWRALSYHPQTAVTQGKVKRGKLEDMVYLWKWPKDLFNKYSNSHTFIFQNVHVFEKPLFCSLKLLTI